MPAGTGPVYSKYDNSIVIQYEEEKKAFHLCGFGVVSGFLTLFVVIDILCRIYSKYWDKPEQKV